MREKNKFCQPLILSNYGTAPGSQHRYVHVYINDQQFSMWQVPQLLPILLNTGAMICLLALVTLKVDRIRLKQTSDTLLGRASRGCNLEFLFS